MYSNLTKHRKSIATLTLLIAIAMMSLSGRLSSLMLFCSEHYSAIAEGLHQREHAIKAARRRVIDTNGVVTADNRTVRIISVICNQVKDQEQVIRVLCDELDLDEGLVREWVRKRGSREIIKTNVSRELGDQTRSYRLADIRVDEDYKWYYLYDSLAFKVLGFTGGDNQGITNLEVKYEKYLKEMNGKVLTMSDAKGVKIENATGDRIEPMPGNGLHISLDVNIQKYMEQLAYQVLKKRNAEKVLTIVMNPRNGEPMAMVNVPEFDLNDPFTLSQNPRNQSLQELAAEGQGATRAGKQGLLNQMWRSTYISDTHEPGSTFKIITAAAGLESGAVKLTDQFPCPGFGVVEDRKVRYHKVGGHGTGTFLQGVTSSYNPVFIDVRQRLGVGSYYKYFTQFGLKGKVGVDLPGEAATIMHKKEGMRLVELATVSFGQSFQITSVQLTTTAAPIVNGGSRITPHFGVKTVNADGISVHKLDYSSGGRILPEGTSATIRYVLEQVVLEGSGKKVKLEGYRIGGKAATSGEFPRNLKKYISSFIGFVLAGNPQVMALITIGEPEGAYYGGTITAPVVGDLSKNIFPYLGIGVIQEETVAHPPNPQLIIPEKRRILTTK